MRGQQSTPSPANLPNKIKKKKKKIPPPQVFRYFSLTSRSVIGVKVGAQEA